MENYFLAKRRIIQSRSQASLSVQFPKLLSVPHIKAESWAVAEGHSGRLLGGKEERQRREIASLTKIMTCYVVLKLMERYSVSMEDFIRVSGSASSTGGTSAGLRQGEEVSLWDLLFALMLPSGNDAAVCLAEHFGRILAICDGESAKKSNTVKYFVGQMNFVATTLRLKRTFFANPHGMSTSINTSTAQDVCRLTAAALRNETFRAIVSTKTHTCAILRPNGFSYRGAKWENTNFLLRDGYFGVKTGITPNAGPCLCAARMKQGRPVIVVLLGASSKNQRWVDAPRLVEWGAGILTNRIVQ